MNYMKLINVVVGIIVYILFTLLLVSWLTHKYDQAIFKRAVHVGAATYSKAGEKVWINADLKYLVTGKK